MIGKDGIGSCGPCGPCGPARGPVCGCGDVRDERRDCDRRNRGNDRFCELGIAFVVGLVFGQCCVGNSRRDRGCGRC